MDELIPHSAWERRAGISWSMLDLGSGVKVFARVQESTPVELVNGSGLWKLSLEGKDFATKLGFGPFDPLPAAACVSVMESAFDYLQHYGMLRTSDVFTTGRINRIDVTVDLDPGLNDVSAFLHVFADSFPLHKSRRFTDGGVTGVSVDGVRHERLTAYDKQRLRSDQGFDNEPPRLRFEFNYMTNFLRQYSLEGPFAMTDELCTDLFTNGVRRFGLRRDWQCRDQLWAIGRAAGIDDHLMAGLAGYLDASQRGVSYSPPTRRKYDRLADQLGVRGMLDGTADPQQYSIDWDQLLLTVSDTPEVYSPGE